MAFKSNDRTFEKIYGAFDKRDYFNSQGLAKVQIGNFERALKKNDKGAQQILDKFKGDLGKAKDYITQVITDRKKEDAFNQYKAFKVAVDSIQKGKPQYGAVDLVKSRIHNSSQKYTIALYSALRNKKFTKWKDVHNDVDSLIGESVNEAKGNPKFKVGNKVNYIPKLSGLNPKKKLEIIRVRYEDGDRFTKPGWYYSFKGTNLSAAEKDIKLAESVNENKFLDALKDFFRKEEPTFGQMAKRYKKKSDFIKWFVKSQAKQGVVFKNDGYGAYMMNRMGRIWDRVHGKPEDKKYVGESVNEGIEPQIKKIAYYTGTRPEAVEDFVSKHSLNITKLLKYVEKGGLPQRMELVAALAGRPNNPKQKKIIKTFQESVNERYSGNSKDFKYDLENALDKIGISYKAIKKISKKGKGFEVRMSSYMKNRDAWEKLGKEIGAELVDFKPGSINIGLYESKGEVEQIAKKTKSETAFYDVLSKIEKKYGKRNYRLWLEKSLKDLGVNPKHYDYRTNAAAEEKLYQLTK